MMVGFFAIGFYTGMRTGEIMALKWSSINFEKNTILVNATHTASRVKDSTKNGKSREVNIIPSLDEYLLAQKAYTFFRGGYVFMTQYGRPYMNMTSIVQRYWKPALERLGLRYREPYQMRHTFACMMIDARENIKWVANMLGHADLSMVTKRYGNWYAPIEGRAGMKYEERKEAVL